MAGTIKKVEAHVVLEWHRGDEYEWEMLCEQFGEILEAMHPDARWHAEVRNFGWRNVDGEQQIHTNDGAEVLRKLLPETDCRFQVFQEDDQIKIRNWHHDSPAGNEWYILQPMESNQWCAYCGATTKETFALDPDGAGICPTCQQELGFH